MYVIETVFVCYTVYKIIDRILEYKEKKFRHESK